MRTVFSGVLTVSILSAGLPLAANAQGWLVGAAGGTARQNDYDVGGPVATREDTDSAARLFGGFEISPNQAVIASYVALGTMQYDGPAFGGFTDSLEADGYDISYVFGGAPGSQRRFSLFGTVGLLIWEQEVSYMDSFGPFEVRDKGTSFSFGVGTEIKLGTSDTGPWGLHVDYQIFKDVGDETNSGHELDREFASVGIAYRFGRPRN